MKRALFTLMGTLSSLCALQEPIITSIPVLTLPQYMVITNDSRYLYVTNTSNSSFSVIDTQVQAISETVEGLSAYRIYNSPDSRYVYIVGFSSDVNIVDTQTNEVTVKTTAGAPVAVTSTADGKYAYVSVDAEQKMYVLETGSFDTVTTFDIDERPWAGVSTPDSSQIYVLGFAAGTVAAIDTSTYEVTSIPIGEPIPSIINQGPFDITVSSDGAYVYAVNEGHDTAHIIDTSTNKLVKTLDVEDKPWSIELTPNGQYAYVANSGSSSVSVIDTQSQEVITTIEVGLGPVKALPSPDGHYVYVANQSDDTVSVIAVASQSVVATLSVGNSPGDLVVAPDGRYVYTLNWLEGTISAILSYSAIDQMSAQIKSVKSVWCEEFFGDVVWGDIIGVERFELYRDDQLVVSLSGDVTGYQDHNLDSNHGNQYTLKVIMKDGNSYTYTLSP